MLGEACALGAALTWAISVILFKRSEAIPPLGLNLFKNTVAILGLLITLPALGVGVVWDRPASEWLALAASGVLGIALADTLFFVALRKLGPGLTTVIDCAYTPTVVGLSGLLLGEPIGVGLIVGGAMVLGGVGVVAIQPGALGPPREGFGVGVAAGLLGIIALAIGVILARPILAQRELVEVMLVRLVFGVTGQLVYTALTRRGAEAFAAFRPSPVWRQLVPAAILSTYFAMLLWLAGFKWAGASVAAVLNQTSTIFTLILAWLILGEPLSPRRALGAAVAFAGVAVVLFAR